VKVEVSQVIDRPVADVFRFFAVDHIRNHPRWDPHIELWPTTDEPIGVGTVIRRRNSRSGTPVEGTTEIVEFEPNRSMGGVTREGPMEVRGRATFEAEGDDRTVLTLSADMPGLEESMRGGITGSMEQSVRNIKELVESEY
jgi:uncharacterized protein YndB with AHSA1/START domain